MDNTQMDSQKIIIYNTDDGKTSVSLMTRYGNVWLNQNHLAELFDTSKQNISLHIINILKENELNENSVVKDYLTTVFPFSTNSVIKDYLTTEFDDKNHNVTYRTSTSRCGRYGRIKTVRNKNK